MGRVSVPLWGAFLSEPLPIAALVGRYPANKLIGREPIRRRRNFQYRAMRHNIPSGISRRFHRLSPGNGHVAHALRTLPPVAARILLSRAAPRLACVKPAASVHPEPGSNSSLYIHTSKLSPDILNSSKEINALDSIAFFSVLACTCLSSAFSMIFLFRRTPSGGPGRPALSFGIAKVVTFSDSANLFWRFFCGGKPLRRKNRPPSFSGMQR